MIRKIKPGDTVVFQHPSYGTLIKQVESTALDEGSISVIGTNPDSVDSRRFGPIQREDVVGKVIWHIAMPGR